MLRQHNLLSVTGRMREREHFSKIDLARELAISSTTMGKLFVQLETAGIIEPCPVIENVQGRPKRHFQLSPAPQAAAAVIGIQTSTVCLSGLDGRIQTKWQRRFPTGKSRPVLFKKIRKQLRELEQASGHPIRILGICMPGLIASEKGESVLNPNLPFLEGSRPGEWFQKEMKLPTLLLHEEYALSRAQISAVTPEDSVISVDFSSGVGMCVIDRGLPVTGVSGFAGEIGHVVMNPDGDICGCGNRGCLETMASDRVLSKNSGGPLGEDLEKVQQGDPGMTARAKDVLKAQALGLAAVINLFNPGRIFVHSQLAEVLPGYLEDLREQTRKNAIPPSFEQCGIEITREGKLQGTLRCSIDHLIAQQISAITGG